MSVGVSMLGNIELLIEPGINIAYYLNVFLGKNIPPSGHSITGETFTFPQDNAPAQRVHYTVECLSRHAPAFIPPWLWLPNSPDVNPVDYEVCFVLQR